MAELLDEDLLPFAVGIRSLPGRPHVSTGYRILNKGSRGVFLETIMVGGRRYTSKQALRRFVAAVTAAGRVTTVQANLPPDPQADEYIDLKLNREGL